MIEKALLNIFGLAIGMFLLLFLFLNLVIAKGVLIEDLAGPASTILAGLAALIGAVMTISQMRNQHRKEIRLISKSMELQHFENYKKSVDEVLSELLHRYSGYVGEQSSQKDIGFSAPDLFYNVHDFSVDDVIPPLEVEAIIEALQQILTLKADVELVEKLLNSGGEIDQGRVVKTLKGIADIVNDGWNLGLVVNNRCRTWVELDDGESYDLLVLDCSVYFQYIELFIEVATRLGSLNYVYRARLDLDTDLDGVDELIEEANYAWEISRGVGIYEVTSFLDDIS